MVKLGGSWESTKHSMYPGSGDKTAMLSFAVDICLIWVEIVVASLLSVCVSRLMILGVEAE